MSKLLKALAVASLSVAATSVFAGGIEPTPMADPSGVFVGAGAGYTSMTNDVSDLSLNIAGTSTINMLSFSASNDGLAPFAQVGYWGMINQTWMWGVKGFYKYVNQSSNYIYNDDVDEANADTQVKQEAAALLMVGAHFKNMIAYIGAGGAWLPTTSTIRSFEVAGANGSSRITQANWGGIVQIGTRVDLTPDWFVDTAYSYAFSGKKTFANTVNFLGTNYAWSRKIRVNLQQFDISVNYRFAV